MATKDDLSAWNRFCTIDANQLTLVLRKATEIEADFTMNFPLVTDTENPYKNTEILGDKFYLMRENSNLKRDKRLNSQKQSNLFIRYFHRVIPLIKTTLPTIPEKQHFWKNVMSWLETVNPFWLWPVN